MSSAREQAAQPVEKVQRAQGAEMEGARQRVAGQVMQLGPEIPR